MKKRNIQTYFIRGVTFLRQHPQLWFTAVVGLLIISSFLYFAWRFATIAHDAQEELTNVRAGSILDSFVLFAPDGVEEPDILRGRMAHIKTENPTIDSFVIYATHGNDEWRVFLSENGPQEGVVIREMPKTHEVVLRSAKADPGNAYTTQGLRNNERFFITAKALQNESGAPIAVALTEQGMAEADKAISENINTSMYLLVGVLFIITILFFRHARIVDFAVLYKKQLEIDEMKDSFISMASHELKSPLSVIRGYVEFLKEGVKEEEKRNEFLHRIDVSADELRHLVDDILDVSRIEMGRLRFSPEHVEPHEILHEITDMFKDQANKKGLNIYCEIDEDSKHKMIRVDRGRLKQVIINLISNAVKYTLKGDITVSQKVRGENLELSVRDSGVGMTAEELKKLFGKFYRAEADETKSVSGTGLGLWITKYIIDHMNGSISVESIQGEGSRFVVQFPLHQKD